MTRTIQDICLDFFENKTERTFETAMNRLRPGIANHLMKLESDYETRNYLLNITFTKMWTEIDKYDPTKGHFSTWIYKIAYNEALQHKRYTNRHSSLDYMVDSGSVAIAGHTSIVEEPVEFFDEIEKRDLISILYDEIIESIHKIPNDKKHGVFKEILTKRIIEKKKYNLIASEIGIPENTAKGRFRNGKKLIGKILEEKNPELVGAFRKFIKEK